ncbi:hypothetical protein E4P41_08610 [Geodermatophilus sp. DF01-2]|uniref:ParB/RepB/Spo0J family partition protein n=1 Tax=Geodermatophilus sp. DF01-2 TaxID=2559610 RepID=UPI001073CF2E|nr:ParB N-terminal domain-containing protein [Geodermatophilus sp. DF01_2]TFV62051.1 hypothetical protein E4P41_08610 [Geodermatophilus sp. DF01_2]
MKLVRVKFDDLVVSDELRRSGSSKQFEDRLKASISEIGLAEPLKVARTPEGKFLIVDGVMRYRAIVAIRGVDPSKFKVVPAYHTDFARRFEIRYQTDIYQDLLPSQLAGLVEHLHKAEQVSKSDIARYIGVSPATLRNYTGLWRLMQRGGLFAQVVELMDAGVFPSSNPFAWLRLTATGLRHVIESSFATEGASAEQWVEQSLQEARRGQSVKRYPTKLVETVTDGLPPDMYREAQEVREVKRDLGLRRAAAAPTLFPAKPRSANVGAARRHLTTVSNQSREPVLQTAAQSLLEYLK